MGGYLKQSTAAQNRLIGPFIDDTDFTTLETGLTIANTDIRVSKDGANIVAKNSGGGTHDENGMYQVTWDATDTDTVGSLQVSVSVAGALVVWEEYWVLEEDIFEALFAAGAAAFDSNDDVTVAGHIAQTGDNFARLGAPAGASVSADIAAVQSDTDDIQTRIPGAGPKEGTADSGTVNTMVDAELNEADTDFWKGSIIIFTTGNLQGQARLITGFTPANDTITFSPDTTQAVGTHGYRIEPAGRADIELWLGSVVNALVSGRVDASVGSMAADVVTAAAIAADAIEEIARALNPQQNAAFSDITFEMYDSTNHNPNTGLTVTGERSLDGGAYAAVSGTIAEISDGTYQLDALAADMNGALIVFRFSAAGADDTFVHVKTAA